LGKGVKFICFLLAMTVLICGCDGAMRAPLHAQFCDLVSRPNGYKGAPVAFHAHIDSNGMDRSELSDPDCPGYGLLFDVSRADGTFSQASRIIMGQGRPGTVDKVVEADFVGVLHGRWSKPNLMYLTSVQNVSYRMIDDKK
jgi:hypothetical protein